MRRGVEDGNESHGYGDMNDDGAFLACLLKSSGKYGLSYLYFHFRILVVPRRTVCLRLLTSPSLCWYITLGNTKLFKIPA